jgi:hypothetical protein
MFQVGGLRRRAFAGATIASAARVVILATFLACIGSLFAARAQASVSGGVQSEAGAESQGAQTVQGAAQPEPGSDGSGATGGASSGVAEPTVGGEAAPVASSTNDSSEAPALALARRVATSVSAGSQASAQPNLPVKTPLAPSAPSSASSAGVGGALHDPGASAAARAVAASILDRQRHVLAIVSSWPPAGAAPQLQTERPVGDLYILVVQFESLTRAIPAESARLVARVLARSAAKQLALIPAISPSPLALSGADGARLRLVGVWTRGSSVTAHASLPAAGLESQSKRSARHGRGPELPAASRTTGLAPPALAGTALGGTPAGVDAPAAVLLVLAAACLLGTRRLGRRNMDLMAWTSASLNLRLERPG